MLKMIKAIGILLLCLNMKQVTAQSNFETFEHPVFSIGYPENWTMDSSHTFGTVVFFNSPFDDENDHFKENINIIIQPLGGEKVSLNAYADETTSQMKAFLKDGELLSSEIIRDGSKEYLMTLYTMGMNGNMLKVLSYAFIYNGSVYLFTLTCNSESYEKYEALGKKILGSIQFK